MHAWLKEDIAKQEWRDGKPAETAGPPQALCPTTHSISSAAWALLHPTADWLAWGPREAARRQTIAACRSIGRIAVQVAA